MPYYHTNELTVSSALEVDSLYDQGYVLTRNGKGHMIQTRSLRIDLNKFELNSENRRILRKNDNLNLTALNLPLDDYSWEIHALGKTFYDTKFGDGTMSAAKIKEMFTEVGRTNMNMTFKYTTEDTSLGSRTIGYCLFYQNAKILHYAYPFYDLKISKEQNIGIGMMTKAIEWAKSNSKRYIYLGSIVEESSKYKLQFEGLEWWNNSTNSWSTDINKAKELLN